MKQLLTLIFLLLIFNTHAQVVNIPDTYFKYILLSDSNINTNHDNEIQETEAITATSIHIRCILWTDGSGQGGSRSSGPVDITGIKSFTNLERLQVDLSCADGGGIKRIDLDGMARLRYVSIFDSAARYISCKNCTALDSLVIDNFEPKGIDTVDCSGCSSLTYYKSGFYASVSDCVLTGCTNLKSLYFYNGNIITPLNQLTDLETLHLFYFPSLNLDVSNLTKLKSVFVEEVANFTGINVTGCSLLERFVLNDLNPLSPVPELDFSTCYNLKELAIPYSNQPIPGLNLKNGSQLNSLVIGTSLHVMNICADDFETDTLRQYFTNLNQNPTITSACSPFPLPVKLQYFSVNKKDNSNQLNWKASCTYGNANFVIERSNDGIRFSSIGNINATAVRCQLPFTFMDNNPVAGKNYYRLKITDADGISFYSKVLAIRNSKAGLKITAVVNNMVYLSSNKQQVITMKVIAADGTVVANQQQTLRTGNSTITLPMISSAAGMYTLIVYINNGEIITKRFVK
jgi:hypothetical protein